ncbi:MAG: hypothetical protein IKT98_03750, partial [Selenomonadaceae bacterium]|nr:hypothetical protein [Selenomonadaceae bacterium]
MNRKVKSIVNAAVAMGYGQLSDYSGNSVSEVLAEFAAKAQEAAKLPAAAAADAGKVPTVQAAGGYALAAIPTELPAATASDEGKVLSVDSSGGYVLAQKSVEDFDIEFECDDGNSEYTVSVTREQVVAAIQAGKKIYFVDNITAERLLATFVDVNQTEQGDAPTLCAY